jgi:ribosomal protein S12 methylthiotransferase accessory factor
MELDIRLGDGRKVEARWDQFTVRTDQGVDSGGEASAPEPFDLFLASFGTCAGHAVLAFCRAREIPTDGVRLVQRMLRHSDQKRLSRIEIEIVLPVEFPEKYRKAVARAAEACSVKKAIQNPPAIAVSVRGD